MDRSSSTAGEVAGHCGLLATSRMTPSARRVAGGRSLEASGLGRVSGIMPRVYVHVRPHERLDLTSHLTGSRRGQSRAAVASTFTIWVADAQAELVAGTTITRRRPRRSCCLLAGMRRACLWLCERAVCVTLWPPKVPLWTLSTRLPGSIQGARRSAACEARV